MSSMHQAANDIRRIQEAAKAPNLRLPANCLKGMRLPAKICYVSNQTVCFDFHGTEYVFDRRTHGEKRLIIELGSRGEDATETVLTFAQALDKLNVHGVLIDLSSGDIILQGVYKNA